MEFIEFEHLKNENITYFQHFVRASYLTLILTVGSLQSLVHALYPDYFVNSATELNKKLTEILDSQKREAKEEKHD
tara:strand:- start:511 stop:738 length:228 start_codon:yes stop_codon:yes gene_type:complete